MKKHLLNFRSAALVLGIFFSLSANAQFTAVTSGNWSSSTTWGGAPPTGTVTNQNIVIPPGVTVTLDANVTFAGLLNNFVVNGVLTNTTSNEIIMTQGDFTGNGNVSVSKITFMLLATSSYSGNLNLKNFSNNTTSSSLAFVAIANISDTLFLETGNLLLNTNSNLTMLANSTVKVANGAISTSSGVFNSGNAYNVMYTGNSKTAGVELNTVTLQHLYLKMNNNNQTISLNNNTIINGNLDMGTGKLALNGKKLTLKGNAVMTSGSMISSTGTSDMLVEGTGTLSSVLVFAPGSSINDLTINRTTGGQASLGSALDVKGHLNLMDGNLIIASGGSLTATSGSTVHVEKGILSVNSGTFIGTSSYNVEYMGSTDVTSGAELNGSGLNNVIVNYSTTSNKVIMSGNTLVSGKLHMMKGKLDLNGKILMLNGTLAQTSNATFKGSSTSELELNMTSVGTDSLFFDATDASSQTLRRLKVNNAGSGAAVVIGSKLNIDNELAFIKGKIELANGDLVIMPAASITGYDDTKYIITSGSASGKLVMNVISGAAYVTFPIGLSGNYSPAYVQQASAATSGNFSAKCSVIYNMSLKAVNRIWDVESGVAVINANLKLGWMPSAELNGFNRNTAYISHYTSSAWDVAATSSAVVAANNTFELSRTGFTSLSPFAVVEQGQPLKINEIARSAGFELYPNPSKDLVYVKLNNSSDNYKYELTDITGRTISMSTNTNTENRFDISNLVSGCYFIKVTSLSDNKTTTKRFIKN
jgi:hypothetical protein